MLGRMFGHEFRALLIFQKFLISDDFAALFGISSPLGKCDRIRVRSDAQKSEVVQRLDLTGRAS